MAQFRVLNLVKVGIIIISNFMISPKNAHGGNLYKCNKYQESSDTIKILENDYKIVLNEKYSLRVEITNPRVLQALTTKPDPVILFSIGLEKLIAKGNYIILSSVPSNCDLFYATDKKGCLILYEHNLLIFTRVNKVKGAGAH
ncbi:hypothetical protein A4R26_29840 [Niastella populi]|uniref:Uncharacterized protein n=1 Tax=Niastella populi TaxID=550983 RepID=A0A1V9EYV7_9BACT|nr:hypothetical protein A4R26_29840 [Niastella populi]